MRKRAAARRCDVGDVVAALLFAAVVPATVNAGFRLWLQLSGRRRDRRPVLLPLSRILVIIPSRAEGEAVRATLESVRTASLATDGAINRPRVEVLLLLDGEDERAASIGKELGARVVVKTPAGPSKAAALAWLVSSARGIVESCDAVMVLDVRSRLSRDFFSVLRWPQGADAVQAVLSGEGEGVGEAVARSERLAQEEDAARVAAGWSARIRGTGTLFTPAAFERTAAELRTQIEDTEMSLLLMSRGGTIALADERARVIDAKPESVEGAARQRARWLSGQAALFVTRREEWRRLIGRNPVEGIDFASELASKPRSLFLPLRLVASLALLRTARRRKSAVSIAAATVVTSTTLVDLASWGSNPAQWRSAAALLMSWMKAAAHAPRAAKRWMRAGEP